MSHLFAIGVDRNECTSTPLIEKLEKERFINAGDLSHEYVAEARDFLNTSDTRLNWYFATEGIGNPDLDLTYQLPKEIDGGRLKNILDIVVAHQDITMIGILMYDLGTRRSTIYDDLALDDIKTTLKSWYEFGGPDLTVYHLFKRE